MKYTYYPGCSLEASGKEYDMSFREVAKGLDMELVEVEDWNCCGATAAYSVNDLLSHALTARNIALAEKEGHDMIAPCSECYHKQFKTNKAIHHNPDKKDKINKALDGTGLKVEGKINIKHPVDVFINDIGAEKITEKVTKKLEGLKVASYYGCVMTRPDGIFDSPEYPTAMDKIVKALGATPVDFREFKTKCCGGPVLITKEDAAYDLTAVLLGKAKEFDADIIITACPLCHMMLDAKQPDIELALKKKYGVPILYISQLMGLAMGIEPKKLGLDKNFVDTGKVVKMFQ